MISLDDFDFSLPEELIASSPCSPRDHSRLLVFERDSGRIYHKCFFDIGKYLTSGDLLVLNNSKVFPARLLGQKGTGGRVEILLDRPQTLHLKQLAEI